MALEIKDVGLQGQMGDIFSSKSSASANPVSGITFAPVKSVIFGSPNAYTSDKGSVAPSINPTIDAPITDYRPSTQGMAKGDGAESIVSPVGGGLPVSKSTLKAGEVDGNKAGLFAGGGLVLGVALIAGLIYFLQKTGRL